MENPGCYGIGLIAGGCFIGLCWFIWAELCKERLHEAKRSTAHYRDLYLSTFRERNEARHERDKLQIELTAVRAQQVKDRADLAILERTVARNERLQGKITAAAEMLLRDDL